jgi:hypothetical protein
MSQGPVTAVGPESGGSLVPELLDPLLLFEPEVLDPLPLFVPEVLELLPELELPEMLELVPEPEPSLDPEPLEVLLALVLELPLELRLPSIAEVDSDPPAPEEEPGELSPLDPHAQNVAVAVATAKKARALISSPTFSFSPSATPRGHASVQ